MIKQGPILQKVKDKHNILGLCYYCGKSAYIAMDYKNPTLLFTKKQVAITFTSNLIALIPYKPLFVKEKKTFLS